MALWKTFFNMGEVFAFYQYMFPLYGFPNDNFGCGSHFSISLVNNHGELSLWFFSLVLLLVSLYLGPIDKDVALV